MSLVPKQNSADPHVGAFHCRHPSKDQIKLIRPGIMLLAPVQKKKRALIALEVIWAVVGRNQLE